MDRFGWQCPFCGQVATIREHDIHSNRTTLSIENGMGRVSLQSIFVVCPNDRCKQFTLQTSLWRSQYRGGEELFVNEKPLMSWNLIPPSDAKVLPTYIPKPIVSDYLEACAIKDLSPKASATLARRCIQGMIRDFWKISKPRLCDEIDALRDKVDSQTWDAIDAVRSVGNIGAHMEREINTIVDVDPEEAGCLIALIETLLDDWYVARYDREQRMARVIALGQAKQNRKQGPPAQA